MSECQHCKNFCFFSKNKHFCSVCRQSYCHASLIELGAGKQPVCFWCYPKRYPNGFVDEQDYSQTLKNFDLDDNAINGLLFFSKCNWPVAPHPKRKYDVKPKQDPTEGVTLTGMSPEKAIAFFHKQTVGHERRTRLHLGDITTYLGNGIFLGGTLANQDQINDFYNTLRSVYPESHFPNLPPIVEVAVVEKWHFNHFFAEAQHNLVPARVYYEDGEISTREQRPAVVSDIKFIEHIVQPDDLLEFNETAILTAAFNVIRYLLEGKIISIHCKSGMGRSFILATVVITLLCQHTRPPEGSLTLARLVYQIAKSIKCKRSIAQNDLGRLVWILEYVKAFFRLYDTIPTTPHHRPRQFVIRQTAEDDLAIRKRYVAPPSPRYKVW